MKASASRSLLGVVVAVALIGAVGVTGCWRQNRVAPPAPQPTTLPASGSVATSTPTTGTAAAPTPTVDAAGAAIGTSLTVGSAKQTSKGGIPRPTDKVAMDEAVRLLRKDQGIGKVKSISVRSMTQDEKGHWWVLIAIEDDVTGANEAVMTYDGKTWDDRDFGEGVSNDDLPPDVRF